MMHAMSAASIPLTRLHAGRIARDLTMVYAIWLLLIGVHSVACIADNVCGEEPEVGDCRAALPMFYYNTSLDSCVEFIWGGCGGVGNRFPSREACFRRCKPDVCLLQPEVGPCKANIRQWFYNAEDRVCLEFSYGGCLGNENRFASQQRCETACAGTNLACEVGDSFHTLGEKSVHNHYREREYFSYSCDRRCREKCIQSHAWGTCQSYSVRERWYGCYCYLFDRFISRHEFDQDTTGRSGIRLCSDEN